MEVEIMLNKEMIEKVINESPDLITALEAVGAMYCIPPSHILQDDTQQSIKVVNDTIIAPNRKNANANTQSIVCAIGSVLDYISQRVDSKLNDFQSNAIEKSKFDTAVANGDPNKGKVVKRFETDEGDEIIVYDSGIVDRPMTKSALMKVADLKRNGEIPEKSDDNSKKKEDVNSYFSDSDDITSDAAPADNTPEPEMTDVGESVDVSDDLLDLITEYDNSVHLGYDIFSEMGFDIKPTDSIFYQEAKQTKQKIIKPEDIKHMKFDNKHILKAVKYFNEARAEQSNVKFSTDIDITKFINNPNYHKAVRELEEQFDCHLSIKWFKERDQDYENAGVHIFDKEDEHKTQIMVSKSKGFKLNGMSIWCAVENYGLFSDAPVDQKLFGQTVVSVLLHEIFHCIADSIRTVTDSFIVNTTATIALMASCRSAKRKREIATKYVNSLRNFDIVNLKNPMKRRALVKYMMLLTSLQQKADIKHLVDQTNASEMSEDDIDKLIAEYRKNISRLKKFKKFTQSPLLALVSAVISFILGLALMSTAGGISGFLFIISFIDLSRTGICAINKSTEKLFDDAYKNGQAFEESWADMFAGIYNFPLTFYIKNLKGRSKNFTPNTVNNVQKLNELAKLEKEMFTILRVPYPTNSERNHAAAKLAENALKQKGLDPAVKEYLTWIKNNFSSMLETDIENEGISSTYDPNRAGDVDQHIQDIINQGNVTVTESFA
jgi:hypothetical protein